MVNNTTMTININTATAAELQQIIQRRPFKDLYELSNVLGLGKKRMDDIIAQNVAHVK